VINLPKWNDRVAPREWVRSIGAAATAAQPQDDKAKTIMIRIMGMSMSGQVIDRVAVV
jgi:hypothetical protein